MSESSDLFNIIKNFFDNSSNNKTELKKTRNKSFI